MLAEAATLLATVTERLAAGRFRVRLADGSVHPAVTSSELAKSDTLATGDRVSLIPPGAAFPGVIVRVVPEADEAPRTPSAPFTGRTKHVSPEDLRVDRGARPDWPTGAERTPGVGEEVYCTEGLCTVTRLLGRTGNGSRLLELQLIGGERRAFFAAASNVLVHPGTA